MGYLEGDLNRQYLTMMEDSDRSHRTYHSPNAAADDCHPFPSAKPLVSSNYLGEWVRDVETLRTGSSEADQNDRQISPAT